MSDRFAGYAGSLAAKRVVIVDDSRSMRVWLRHMLDNDTRLEVVGEAADAAQARAVIKAAQPDVITLDIEMPGMNGLGFLKRLMRLRPLPVVMVSSATVGGSDATVQSLSLGAVDCVLNPQFGGLKQTQRDLVRRVFSAGCSQGGQRNTAPVRSLHHPSVDALFISACGHANETIAVVLTGLGRDGGQGIKLLRDAGARAIGQDCESSVVYGMPRAAFELDAAERQLPLDQIGAAVNGFVQAHQINRQVHTR